MQSAGVPPPPVASEAGGEAGDGVGVAVAGEVVVVGVADALADVVAGVVAGVVVACDWGWLGPHPVSSRAAAVAAVDMTIPWDNL